MKFKERLRKVWRDPVGSAVIAATIFALISYLALLLWSYLRTLSLKNALTATANSVGSIVTYRLPFWTVGVIVILWMLLQKLFFHGRAKAKKSLSASKEVSNAPVSHAYSTKPVIPSAVASDWASYGGPEVPSDILAVSHGALAVWARVSEEHNRISNERGYRYIIGHAGNRGLNFGNPAFATYPHAWAIRRTLPIRQDPRGLWSFWCNGAEPPRLEISSSSIVHEGWHLFTVEWSRDENFVRFYIDTDAVGQNEYQHWPQALTGNMVLGTWVNDRPNFKFNSEVGPCYTIARTLQDGELLGMVQNRPA